MALGMILLGIGFIFLCIANSQTIGEGSNEPIKVGMSFVIFAYLFHTIGELCLSPIGLSMVSKLSPVKFASIMMGVWFLSSFFANIIGGYIASLTSFLGAGTIFLGLAIFSILVGVCLLLINKWLVTKSHGIL
jgi:POT family proton-dependent oligopeptide transporter